MGVELDSSHYGRMGLTFFEQVRVLIFAHRNREVRSIFFEFLYTVEGGNRARYLCFWCLYRHYRGDP